MQVGTLRNATIAVIQSCPAVPYIAGYAAYDRATSMWVGSVTNEEGDHVDVEGETIDDASLAVADVLVADVECIGFSTQEARR